MSNQPDKNVKMRPEPHAVIKEYCKDNGLKFARFIEMTCLRFIEEETKKDGNKEV
jgi:hypothetical protein